MKIQFQKLNLENKNYCKTVIVILITINIILSFIGILLRPSLLKIILISTISIVDIILLILILLKYQNLSNNQKDFQNFFDPILTEFFIKNSIEGNNNLILAELKYLLKLDKIKIQKNDGIYDKKIELVNREQFQKFDSIEKINEKNIEEYYKEEPNTYESLFVTKILFPFENEISINKLINNLENNYYIDRINMYSNILEKIIIYKCEKNNYFKKENKLFPILIIINIIIAIFTAIVSDFNIILIIATIFNIILSAIILKNERIFSYDYTDEINEKINQILNYKNSNNNEINIIDILLNKFEINKKNIIDLLK